MKYATIRLVFDRNKVATKEHVGLVQLEVMYQRRRKWLSTGVKVYAGQWHERNHVVKRMDALELNLRLNAQVEAANAVITDMIRNGEAFSFEAFMSRLAKEDKNESFLEFLEMRIDERGDIRESTKKQHRVLISILKEYGKIRLFSDLTKVAVVEFDTWLHSRYDNQTTVWGFHKRMKIYINDAIRHELLEKNPYDGFKVQRGKQEGVKYLLKEEVDKIESAKMSSEKLDRIRDLFVFQCYTGLAYSDLARFKWSDVHEEDGDYIIRDVRKKTAEEYFIVLLKPALRVLRKYDFDLPVPSVQKYNDYLKIVVQSVGIDKPVTSHWARHTYAVMALSMGARMHNVARMLGHANTKITESTYAKVLARDVKRDYDMINKKIK